MSALREILAKFGFDIDDTKLEKASEKTDALVAKVKDLAKVFAAGAIVAKTKEWIDQIQEQGDALSASAIRLGVNTHALQQWQVAAHMAGIASGGIETAMKFVQKNAADASDEFQKLGITTQDSTGRFKDADVLLREVGLAIAAIDDPAKRTNFALKLLGKQGAELATLFAGGVEGLEDALATLDEFGGGLSDDLLPLAEEYGDRLDQMNLATLSLKNTLALTLFPTLISSAKWIAYLITSISRWTKGTEIVRSSLGLLGVVLLYVNRQAILAGIKMAIAWAPVILLFTAIALIIDDVWTALKGGDSLIGRIIDSLFGVGTASAIFGEMGSDIDALSARLSKLPNILDKVEEVFSTVGGSLVKFFVDDLPEAWEIFWRDLNQQAGHQGTTFVAFLQGMFGNLRTWFGDWAGEVIDSILNGMIQGLTNGWNKVKNKFQEVNQDLKNSFKAFWGINSPSSVAYDLTEFIPMGQVKALADWAPRVQAQTFKTFNPTIRVPHTSTASGPSSKRIDMHNRFEIKILGGGPGTRDATREGLGLAFDDERRAMLAALESTT